MEQVKRHELTLAQAHEPLGLSYRQTKRAWRRYRLEGEQGLVHGLRGKPGPRAKPDALKQRILACYEERYPDFGPTLPAEYLAAEGLGVAHETLRRWRLARGQPRLRRRRQRHRQWRERKPCFGAMVQLDGSQHDWIEGRGPQCVLMVMVDDATNRVWAQFSEAETTHASYYMVEAWAKRYGLPQSLYADRDSIYRCEGVGTIAEQLAGKAPQTQFGRAMEQLGVELILAHSPQAKGWVERMNGTLQDRLVKALRLEEINGLENATAYLLAVFLPAFNRKSEVQPASAADVHRDWTVPHEGQWYQLDRWHESLALAGKRVTVRKLRDGTIQIEQQGQKLNWCQLSQRPKRVEKAAVGKKPVSQPAMSGKEHPWRRPLLKGGRIARSELGNFGRPPLRSDLPSNRAERLYSWIGVS